MAKSELVFGKLGGSNEPTLNLYAIRNGVSKAFTIDTSKKYVYRFSDGYDTLSAAHPDGNRALYIEINNGVLTEIYNGNHVLTYTYTNNTITFTNGNAGVYAVLAEMIYE